MASEPAPRMPMPLQENLRLTLERTLSTVDDQGTVGPRLLDDARRLWARLRALVEMNLITNPPDLDGLELASYAVQLPQRRGRPTAAGRPVRATLRDRAEEAAEMLLSIAPADTDESLLDRATRILREMPHRSPMVEEAKLLADAVNLDDFGLTGFALLAGQLARQGEGVIQLANGLDKREQYGYWEARLKDGFHFDAVRKIALRRLETARKVAILLRAELDEEKS